MIKSLCVVCILIVVSLVTAQATAQDFGIAEPERVDAFIMFRYDKPPTFAKFNVYFQSPKGTEPIFHKSYAKNPRIHGNVQIIWDQIRPPVKWVTPPGIMKVFVSVEDIYGQETELVEATIVPICEESLVCPTE